MKVLYNMRLSLIMIITLFASELLQSCSSSSKDSDIKVYEYREQIGKQIKKITDIQAQSKFGIRKGDYPESSRKILEEASNSLKELLVAIKSQHISISDVPTKTQQTIDASEARIEEFKLTVRTEDYLVPADLLVNGKSGGYIDFGSHPEYSSFGESGKQKFTIEFWVRLKDVDGFIFLLSTFTDDTKDNPRFQGWSINSWFANMRITYSMGNSDLMEPAYGFNTTNEWVHLAFVTDETGVDGDMWGDYPAMIKMYQNGELKLTSGTYHPGKPYTPSVRNIPMIAFGMLNPDGSRQEDKGANGNMKHIHIWKSAKTQAEIQELMNNPQSVTGTESDLVCGWPFDEIPLDDNDIKDLTGKFSAKLVGNCAWVEK